MEIVEKWITHYCSSHRILLVGEGDFSFAACLGRAFGSAVNMVATSLDSRGPVNDGDTMSQHALLKMDLFDRIVFNFPHAGFFSCREDGAFLIELHKKVVKGVLRNAHEMLAENGEAHITHKTAHPFSKWEIKEIVNEVGLGLFKKVPFSIWDYPGCKNKRGDGKRSNDSFPFAECSTFKFKKRPLLALIT
ncbi:uncharacterized protein At4g26485-like [Durio zibethinus]|uniref:Uncharacterized protein At4g26485-like n=1 Tax=Durio zibethinus TaxID=66656 RepID=A0A6P5WKV9_DURZI|nr:uncharacterized protein At4g26485-like [Durio zibethinus]